jgi:hypothetical protein
MLLISLKRPLSIPFYIGMYILGVRAERRYTKGKNNIIQ